MNIEELEAQEVNENTGQFIVIFGRVGSGKSTMASTFPNSLCLDLEGTASNIIGLKRIKIERGKITQDGDTRDEAFRLLYDYGKQFLKSEKYQTLILDGGLEFTKICQDYSLKSLGRKKMRDHKFADTYLDSRDLAENFIKMLIGNGKNVILITHIDEVTEVDDNDEEYTINRPLLGDKQLVYKIPALASIVGRIEVDKEGTRSFNCVQTDKDVLKNQFNITKVLDATYESLEAEIKKFYKEAK